MSEHLPCPSCQVDLVQASNLSWFGYPEDTLPSARDFLPGLQQVKGSSDGPHVCSTTQHVLQLMLLPLLVLQKHPRIPESTLWLEASAAQGQPARPHQHPIADHE